MSEWTQTNGKNFSAIRGDLIEVSASKMPYRPDHIGEVIKVKKNGELFYWNAGETKSVPYSAVTRFLRKTDEYAMDYKGIRLDLYPDYRKATGKA